MTGAPPLRPYANLHGGSGVTAYAVVGAAIAVEFDHGRVYVYTARRIGARRFAMLRKSADAGRGLATCIARHVRDGYSAVFDDRAHWARAWREAAVRDA